MPAAQEPSEGLGRRHGHRSRLRHPVNQQHHLAASLGERLADRIAAGIGSWRFLIIQSFIVAGWVALNLLALLRWHWDPYPFILLNLAFSTQAAYTGPVLLLAGNRQAQKDRLTLEHAAAEADKADVQNERILAELVRIVQLLESRQRGRRTRPGEALRPAAPAPTEITAQLGAPRRVSP